MRLTVLKILITVVFGLTSLCLALTEYDFTGELVLFGGHLTHIPSIYNEFCLIRD